MPERSRRKLDVVKEKSPIRGIRGGRTHTISISGILDKHAPVDIDRLLSQINEERQRSQTTGRQRNKGHHGRRRHLPPESKNSPVV